MGAILGKCMGAVADPAKVNMAIDKGFALFDKDKSGYIESAEVMAAANKVLAIAKIPVKPAQVQAVFAKAAGADGKLDKAEFGRMVHQVVDRVAKKQPGVAGHAAAPAGTAAAATTAVTPA